MEELGALKLKAHVEAPRELGAFYLLRAFTCTSSFFFYNEHLTIKLGHNMGADIMVEPLDFEVRELLKDVQPEYSPSFTKLVDDTISMVKETIYNIPEDMPVTSKKAPGFVRDVGADKVEFKFKKPHLIEISGSYSIRCIAKPDVNVDLLVRLPKECFHEKDYLNHRYHAKRFLYLCILKKYLKSSPKLKHVRWAFLQNEARKPILIVTPGLAAAPGLSIRIIPTANSLFSVQKLNLTRNNVRALEKDGMPQPTPVYNCSILEDMFMEEVSESIKGIFLGWKELGEALVLLKVWARQRSSVWGYDCLSGHVISVILSYLAKNSGRLQIRKSMNAMQIFRITLDFLVNAALTENGLLLCPRHKNNNAKQLKESQNRLHSPDTYEHFNHAFRMTSSSFSELQSEAETTLGCFKRVRDGGLLKIFMTKIDIPAKYDYCIRLNLKGHSDIHASGFSLDNECWRSCEQKVHSILSQGLGDRAKSIRVIWKNCLPGSEIEDGFSLLDKEPLLVGVTINSLEKAHRVVDIGPHAENKVEACKFRKFWGEKSELRRFKDGTIAESTVWECKQWERHVIIKRIAEYVLMRHLSVSKEDVTVTVDQLDFCLCRGKEDPISYSGSLLEAYEELSKRLRLVNDIPLKVSSVQALDSAVRFTSAVPPEPHFLAKEKAGNWMEQKLVSACIHPVKVVIQLEGSGNWPMDEVATEKTKSAFLLQIGASLERNWGMTCVAEEDNVDVLLSGYAFRLKILHERGLKELAKQAGGKQLRQGSLVDKGLLFCSQHSSMINGLQGRYPIYGPVVRLAKRWAASHLFSPCLVEEAIELLVAHLFLNPWPCTSPSSRICGFLRFLRLLSEYDWDFSPLIVDINSDMTAHDEEEINENFRKSKEESSESMKPAMFLATTYDKLSEAWTSVSPTSIELKRLVAYARSSASLLTNLMMQEQTDSPGWKRVFRTPLNNYDAVVLLHRDSLAFPQLLLFASDINEGRCIARGPASKEFHPFLSLRGKKRVNLSELKSKLMVGFNPLKCYLADVEHEFGGHFKLWYDNLGGDVVGLTWKKSVSKKRAREEDGAATKNDPIKILRAIGHAGKGMVRSVHLLKAPKLN